MIGETSDDQLQSPRKFYFATIPVYDVEAKYQVRGSEGPQSFQAGQQVQWFHYCLHSWSSDQQPPVRRWAVYSARIHVNSVFVTEKISLSQRRSAVMHRTICTGSRSKLKGPKAILLGTGGITVARVNSNPFPSLVHSLNRGHGAFATPGSDNFSRIESTGWSPCRFREE